MAEQAVKVEAVAKNSRSDQNGNLVWGVLYKNNWINVHRQQQPKRGEVITGDLRSQKDKNDPNKTWWDLYPPIDAPALAPEPPPKFVPEPLHPPPLEIPSEPKSNKPTFDQILLAIKTIGEELGWGSSEAAASVMQTVIIQMSLGNIVPPKIDGQQSTDDRQEESGFPWERGDANE